MHADTPNLEDISRSSSTARPTERVKHFLQTVSRRTKVLEGDIIHYVSLGAQNIKRLTKIDAGHLIFAGMRKGKPVFMPLLSK